MSSVNQNLSSRKMVNVADIDHFHFTVIVSRWNREVTAALEKGCMDTLSENGARLRNIQLLYVPGSWELISAARLAVSNTQTDAVICIGVVVRGDTPHFDYICQGVTNGLAQLNAGFDIPVIYSVLTVNTMQQALDRCGGIHGNKGDEAAATAMEMAALRRQIVTNDSKI